MINNTKKSTLKNTTNIKQILKYDVSNEWVNKRFRSNFVYLQDKADVQNSELRTQNSEIYST